MVYGLWVDVEYCTGCRACEIACRQEHRLTGDWWGIKVQEVFLNQGQTYDYIPIPTNLCDLCESRVQAGQLPTCVHHCMAQVMAFGPVTNLAQKLAGKPHSMVFVPRLQPVGTIA